MIKLKKFPVVQAEQQTRESELLIAVEKVVMTGSVAVVGLEVSDGVVCPGSMGGVAVPDVRSLDVSDGPYGMCVVSGEYPATVAKLCMSLATVEEAVGSLQFSNRIKRPQEIGTHR